MRPPRLLVLLFCILAVPVFVYLSVSRSTDHHVQTHHDDRRISSFFSFHPPSTLFPPSAIISLTDDNSTFFVARPAAFGPLLPSKGLSGQLWVGRGFGDGISASSQGELGCSDIPGWSEGDNLVSGHGNPEDGPMREAKTPVDGATSDAVTSTKRRRSESIIEAEMLPSVPDKEDGTDNYLHHPLPDTTISKPTANNLREKSTKLKEEHADIQSLQESAEIAGKVVLLTRGGCGFLEKAKWVQRRGGTALIVGDNTRGGGLVTMYARADTSNITIPSLFTSYTTAHLLSSLVPTGGYIDGMFLDEADKEALDGNDDKKSFRKKKISKEAGKADGPTFTTKSAGSKSTPVSSSNQKGTNKKPAGSGSRLDEDDMGWFRSMLSWVGIGRSSNSAMHEDSRRPPSSGHLSWIAVEEWDEEDEAENRISTVYNKDDINKSDAEKDSGKGRKTSEQETGEDGFLIGVQDWRDPDLVSKGAGPPTLYTSTIKTGPNGAKPTPGQDPVPADQKKSKGKTKEESNLSGGSITPGSGEYDRPGSANGHSKEPSSNSRPAPGSGSSLDTAKDNWFHHFPWIGKDQADSSGATTSHHQSRPPRPSYKTPESNNGEEHEGLWVTLTPTSVSTSPFFDTMLVLVVSPLVTLSVVYSMLLIRSRIRRHRWRAPKSVVDRLPVRTYHTVSSASSTTSLRLSDPGSPSPSTPLLQSRTITARSRPRSHTASSVPAPSSPFIQHSPSGVTPPDHEKTNATKSSKARKPRYTGKQVECCVCLEEYVDGVSRVMSLPCGHEFHAECITPWLTTRRRTCPICKGDVVRSLRSSSPSAPRSPSYRDDESVDGVIDDPEIDDLQREVAETRNDSPSASDPIDTIDEAEDVERADYASVPIRQRGRGLWDGLRRMVIGSRQPVLEVDRDR